MQSIPEVGQLAIVRKRPFVVTEIIPSAPGLENGAAQSNHLIKLSSVEDDGLGEELQVIWELEPGTRVHEKSTLPAPESFDDPKRLQAFLDAVRWGAISQADDKALQSPFRGIAPCSVELYEAVVAVNDVKRPSQFGQERDCWSPFRSERPARPAGQEVACRL